MGVAGRCLWGRSMSMGPLTEGGGAGREGRGGLGEESRVTYTGSGPIFCVVARVTLGLGGPVVQCGMWNNLPSLHPSGARSSLSPNQKCPQTLSYVPGWEGKVTPGHSPLIDE